MMMKYRNNESGWFDIEASFTHDMNGNIFLSSPFEKLVSLIALNVVLTLLLMLLLLMSMCILRLSSC